MSIKNDTWICGMSQRPPNATSAFLDLWRPLIDPYVSKQVGDGVISYGPSSFGYDLRAGYDWKIFTDINTAIVDPKRIDPAIFHNIDARNIDGSLPDQVMPIILPPNSYALTHTLEYIRMPRNVTGLCIGKSTYARCGIHVNITPLEAGWEGQITVEISNATRLPVKVYPGEGIMQVLFFEGEQPAVSYAERKGKYQGQTGIRHAQILQETKGDDTSSSKGSRAD